MANGCAIKFVPPVTPSNPSAGTQEGIETAIGAAVADAVFVFYQGILDQQEHGVLAQATKDAGASRIAKIALLQLDHAGGDLDFTRKAHEQGRCELRRFFNGTDLFRQYGPAEIDGVFAASIDSIFEIVGKVVRDERAFRAAWAN